MSCVGVGVGVGVAALKADDGEVVIGFLLSFLGALPEVFGINTSFRVTSNGAFASGTTGNALLGATMASPKFFPTSAIDARTEDVRNCGNAGKCECLQ